MDEAKWRRDREHDRGHLALGWPNFADSGAARGGMLTLSESAASEWAAAGVRVNTVAPGAIASSGFRYL